MTAIVLATAIPFALFVVWNAVILGSITSFEISSDKIIDPLQQLQSANRVVGVSPILHVERSYHVDEPSVVLQQLQLESIVKNLHHRVVLCWLMKKLVSGEAALLVLPIVVRGVDSLEKEEEKEETPVAFECCEDAVENVSRPCC
ncbi:unnamed protein product [Camellia sinensis]